LEAVMKTPPAPRRGESTLAGFRSTGDSRTVWFSRNGCVVWHADGRRSVLVGGTLIGGYSEKDTTSRNVLLVMLAKEVVLENLAHAFGLTSEAVRLVRRAYEEGGYSAIVKKKRGGREPWKVTGKVKKAVEACFTEGLDAPGTRRKLKGLLSEGTLRKLHREWTMARAAEVAAQTQPAAQRHLQLEEEPVTTSTTEPVTTSTTEPVAPTPTETPVEAGVLKGKREQSGYVVRARAPTVGEKDNEADGRTLAAAGPRSQKQVQFLGAWLLVAMAARQGLHAAVAEEGASKGADGALRLAVDAVTMALGIGQGCVEGVRRLAHKGAAALMRAVRAPTPTWVRQTLGRAAAGGRGFFIRSRVAGELMRGAASRAGELAVFYVDNHLRPYTGMNRLLRGWRMQEKRALPGTTDVHVHDVDGRPLFRSATLMHDSLGKLLLPIGVLLRLALGGGQRILLAFDRAASYAEALAELRDANFEFVAYEKKPYPALPRRCFRKSFILDGERVAWYETRKNLGDGRGRLRRIALRLRGGHQVNLLTSSEAPAAELAAIMAGRWNQENAFRHGVERWGLNQLDGRTFPDFDADAVIPSPLRRRLENSLAVLREVEGRLRRNLARPTREEQRVELERDLARNLAQQQRHQARRPELPTHCTVAEAGLVGKLKRHEDEYKAVIDTIRTVCINAEADLATELAVAMVRPREAKRLLKNFFSAPGAVQVHDASIEVILDVAARSDERPALRHLCRVANSWKLSLPGDPKTRPLRFKTQN